jgi:GNAT superfamily N-acetyltransferase
MLTSQTTGVKIREATIGDIPAMHVVRMAVKENALNNPDLVKLQDYEEFLFKRGKGWVCEKDNQVIGFAIVDLLEHNIWALFLQPDQEKKGLGKQLHDQMMDWYFEQTGNPIWLSTSPGTRAESFYKKAGWKQNGFQKNGEVRFEMTIEDWKSSRR